MPASTRRADDSVTALVFDRYQPSLIGFGALLRAQRWVGRCLLAPDQASARALARRHRPDVGIVDVSDAGPFAADVISPIREAHPAIRLILSTRCERAESPEGLGVGTARLLPVHATADQIVSAVHAVLLSDDARGISVPTPTGPTLTDRERQILAMLRTGATNREIAAELHLGPDAIKKQTTALYRKLDVRNRTEAANRAAIALGDWAPQLHR